MITAFGYSKTFNALDFIAGHTINASYERCASIWIDGTLYIPPDNSSRQTIANGLFFNDTDLYIGGRYREGYDYFACYWTDAGADGLSMVQTILDSSSSNGSYLADITVDSSGVVYAIGTYYVDPFNSFYQYWVDNGSITTRTLTLPQGSTGAKLRSIFILNDDIFISGEYKNASGYSITCYWQDDGTTITCVPLSGYSGSEGRDIWVISN